MNPKFISLLFLKKRKFLKVKCFVKILLQDASGIVESNADAKVRIQVEGGELLATKRSKIQEISQSQQLHFF